mgnify:FL=1
MNKYQYFSGKKQDFTFWRKPKQEYDQSEIPPVRVKNKVSDGYLVMSGDRVDKSASATIGKNTDRL